MTRFRRIRLAALLFGAMILSGCAVVQQAERSVGRIFRPLSAASAAPATKRADQITEAELEQLTYGFADRYFTYIITATENIERNNANALQRRRAHQVRLVQVSAIYDIATNADPFTRLLDLMLVVTLQSQKWIEEDQAERWFGERAAALIQVSRKAREDIWQIAARTMTADQLEVIDYLIWDWRRRNPGVELVSYVRFDDFAAARGKSVVADVKGGGGLLAPVGEATKAVDEARMLAERAFFYAKRLPFLVNWQVRAAVDDLLTESDARELSAALLDASRMLARLPQEIGRERDAIFASLNAQQPMLQSVASQYRGAMGDATALVGALSKLTASTQLTLEMLDRVVTANSGEGKPFDMRQYGATLDKLLAALQEANRLAAATSSVMGGVQPQQFDLIAKSGSSQAQMFAAGIIETAFWRMVAIIVIFFVLLALYRIFSVKLERRMAAK